MQKWMRAVAALACLAVLPLSAAAVDKHTKDAAEAIDVADAAELTWPSPWKPGVTLTYDERYESVDKRGKQVTRITATDVVDVATATSATGGPAQTWIWKDPKFSTDGLPAEMAPMIKAAAESFKGLPVQVTLAAEGNYEAIGNLDALLPRYRAAIEAMFAALPVPKSADAKQVQATKDGLARMVDLLSSRAMVEQQLAELPAAYNFIAGGGLALDTEYEYEDEAESPLGTGTIKRNNVLTMTRAAEGEGLLDVRWTVEPDTDAAMAMVAQFVRQMSGEHADEKEITKAIDILRKDAVFHSEYRYRVDSRTGIVERLEVIETKRVGEKDETERTVLTRRR